MGPEAPGSILGAKTFSDKQWSRTGSTQRMASSGMLCSVDLVRNEVSEERSVFIIRVTRIGELGKTLAVTSNRRTQRRNTKCISLLLVTANVVPISPILVTLMMETLSSSET
jgi:hypothetical protein